MQEILVYLIRRNPVAESANKVFGNNGKDLSHTTKSGYDYIIEPKYQDEMDKNKEIHLVVFGNCRF